jgi:hypothetical protein
MLDQDDMTFISKLVKEVKEDLVREVTSIKGDLLSRVSSLNSQLMAEVKIIHDRVASNKASLDTDLYRLRSDFDKERIDCAKALTVLSTEPCSDVVRHVTEDHKVLRGPNGAWSLLRDVALIATMVGVCYGILKDAFVTPRDLLPKNPIVNGVSPK